MPKRQKINFDKKKISDLFIRHLSCDEVLFPREDVLGVGWENMPKRPPFNVWSNNTNLKHSFQLWWNECVNRNVVTLLFQKFQHKTFTQFGSTGDITLFYLSWKNWYLTLRHVLSSSDTFILLLPPKKIVFHKNWNYSLYSTTGKITKIKLK